MKLNRTQLNLDEVVSGVTPGANEWATVFKADGLYIINDGGVVFGPITDDLSSFRSRYIITPSVSSNNLTVAIKDIAGLNPGAGNRLKFRVGNTEYLLATSASYTKNAGTNWHNMGGAELAAQDVDLFMYAIGETGASAGLKFGHSRIPWAVTMGDFINTMTHEKYIAGNWTNFNASDPVTVIGRFRARLSAGAGYTWTIPTAKVINYPIYETDWLDWSPVHTGFSSAPSTASGGAIRYQLKSNVLQLNYSPQSAGASNTTGYTFTSPFIAKNIASYYQYFPSGWTYDNSAHAATGTMYASPNTNTVTCTKSALGAWTGSGNKLVNGTIFIEI